MIQAHSQDQSRTEQVADQLRRINRVLRASSQEDWTSLSLTRAQLKILVLLLQEGPATVGHLASNLGVTLPSITATVDRLVRQELVSREDDPSDRRRVINRLTPLGISLIERLQEGRRARLVAALQQLSPDELDSLSNGLEKLEQAILRQEHQEE
jgi:DNA-binding MarR family transcriptional regulator